MEIQWTDQQLLERWEDRRAIKNQMGRYVMTCLIKKENTLLEDFWSREREDLCLGFNQGYYLGRDALRDYYEAVYRNNLFRAALIQNAFPEALADKSLEELYGAGPFDNLPASTPLIEIAGDGETAKGLWYCHGTAADLTPGGVASTWSWGYYCADFVKEDGTWRFWHLCWLNDIVTLCGQTWTKPNVPYPPLPEFADVEKLALPAPTVACTVRELYRPDRPFTPTPPLPEPYLHFSETFSYGYQEVAQ